MKERNLSAFHPPKQKKKKKLWKKEENTLYYLLIFNISEIIIFEAQLKTNFNNDKGKLYILNVKKMFLFKKMRISDTIIKILGKNFEEDT